MLLRLLYAQSQVQLEGLQQEEELLQMAPPSPELRGQLVEHDERTRRREDEASMWRLDDVRPTGGPDGKGPLLDSSGKVRELQIRSRTRSHNDCRFFDPSQSSPPMLVNDNDCKLKCLAQVTICQQCRLTSACKWRRKLEDSYPVEGALRYIGSSSGQD